MSGTHTWPCGCVVLNAMERYVTMCAEHEAAFKATHERWTADHRAAQPTTTQQTES